MALFVVEIDNQERDAEVVDLDELVLFSSHQNFPIDIQLCPETMHTLTYLRVPEKRKICLRCTGRLRSILSASEE
jgi:hypothetical protein